MNDRSVYIPQESNVLVKVKLDDVREYKRKIRTLDKDVFLNYWVIRLSCGLPIKMVKGILQCWKLAEVSCIQKVKYNTYQR